MDRTTAMAGDGRRAAPVVDLRSDVLSPPTPAMFEAMARAPIGWPMLGEDPTVNELERRAATLLGMEAAVLVPNTSTANLLALHVGAARGTAVLMDDLAHVNVVEWYPLAMAGLLPRTVAGDRGHLAPAVVAAAFEDGAGGRSPRIAMLVLENTHTFAGGIPIDAAETAALAAVAHGHDARVHLDGARLFNAAVALDVPVASLVAGVDTVALSLSKGLCAPYGGLLVGDAATVATARVLADRIGFGRIHKAGHLAAAGIVALETGVGRLAEDHRRARRLGEGLSAIEGLRVDPVATNLVLAWVDPALGDATSVASRLGSRGVGLMATPQGALRAVAHRGVDDAGIEMAIAVVGEELARAST